jgi:hypothetical protein
MPPRRKSQAGFQLPDGAYPGWAYDTKTVQTDLMTNLSTGLDASEVERRIAKYGHNELDKEPPTPFWKLVLEQVGKYGGRDTSHAACGLTWLRSGSTHTFPPKSYILFSRSWIQMQLLLAAARCLAPCMLSHHAWSEEPLGAALEVGLALAHSRVRSPHLTRGLLWSKSCETRT